MKKPKKYISAFLYRPLPALFFSLLFASSFILNSQTVPIVFLSDSAAIVSVSPGVKFIVRQGSLSNYGYFANGSDIYIEGDVINHDTLTGVGVSGFQVKGNWTNNSFFIAGQSTVHLYDSNQVINGSAVTAFNTLVLSGTGLKSLAIDAEVSDSLALNDREFFTASNTLFVSNTDTNSISRTTGFVSSAIGGKLNRAINDTLEYFYPLGSSAGTPRFRPIQIRGDTTYGIIGGRLANLDADFEGYNRGINTREPDICDINSLYFHHISRDSGTAPVDITMFYDPVDDGSWTQIAHWQDNPRWEKAGLALQGIDTASSFNTLTVVGWNDFSYSSFALMLPGPTLDTTLTVITDASCNGSADGSICVPFPPVTGTPPFQYIWSNDDTSTSCLTGLTAGTYTLMIVDAFSCPSTYTFIVGEPNPIVIDGLVTKVTCKGGVDGSVCLSISGDCPPFTFAWTFPDTSHCLTGLAAGSYSVTVTDSCGCRATKFITVIEPELLVATASGVNSTCFSSDDGQVSVNTVGGTVPYFYLWDTPNSDTTQSVSELAPGTYNVVVTDTNGCEATSNVTIGQPDSLIVTANDNDTIYTGFSTTIDVVNVVGGTEPYSYLWSPPGTLDNPTSPNTTATPESSLTYLITVTDSNGCIATDTLRVQVDVNLYRFPNAFLPSGSDVNRTFRPVTSVTVANVDLKIFNRWGQLVYDGNIDPNDASQGWDGTFKGELQPMDTYVYQAVLSLPDGTQKTERGDFILIR